MTIKAEITIKKNVKYPETPFEASVDFIANGGEKATLSLGRKSMEEAIMAAINPILVMAPNAMQEEIDECYKQMDENPHPI